MPVRADKPAASRLGGCVMRSHASVIFALLSIPLPAIADPLPRHALSAGCPIAYAPVCATKSGDAKGYLNSCLARSDGAADIKLGHCTPGN
jgi:hypothetical protein